MGHIMLLMVYAGWFSSVAWLSFYWETAFYLDSFPLAVYGIMFFFLTHLVAFYEVKRRGYIVR
ncbi:hypothetical protein KASHIRA_01280 [Serratia phage vB_SmaM-Kashira]|nr:hypothetical protein KASHIRA_01280 [Serratia phage vB_SmaM-Kashira]